MVLNPLTSTWIRIIPRGSGIRRTSLSKHGFVCWEYWLVLVDVVGKANSHEARHSHGIIEVGAEHDYSIPVNMRQLRGVTAVEALAQRKRGVGACNLE